MEKSEDRIFEEYQKQFKVEEVLLCALMSSATDAETKECPENFKCSICLQMVYDPQTCPHCDNIYCKICIQAWKKQGNLNCPTCRKELSPQPLNRILKKFLDNTLLSGCPSQDGVCPLSDQPISYEKLLSHILLDCGLVQVTCPLEGCGALFQRSQTRAHYQDECPKVKQRCSGCEEDIPRKDFQAHSCIKHLKTMVVSQGETIKDLQEKVEKLLSIVLEPQKDGQNYSSARPIGQKIYSQGLRGNRQLFKMNSVFFCAVHNTRLLYEPRTRELYRCDACANYFGNIAARKGVPSDSLPRYQCRDCDMDLCLDCINDPKYFAQ